MTTGQRVAKDEQQHHGHQQRGWENQLAATQLGTNESGLKESEHSLIVP